MSEHNGQTRLRDRYLDGELEAEQQAGFDRRLREDADLGRRWQVESRWLTVLAEDPPPEGEPDPAFARRVLREWERSDRPAVLGWIGPRSGAAAAAAVLAACIVWAVVVTPTGRPGPSASEPTDPLSVLVLDASRQIERQPERMSARIQETASLLGLGGLMEPSATMINDEAANPAGGVEQ